MPSPAPTVLATLGCVAATRTKHAVLMTCAVDGLAHLVSDDALAAGLTASRGFYAARCGHQVAAAPLISPPGPRCPRCVLPASRGAVGAPRHRRSGRWRRWLGSSQTAAGPGLAPNSPGLAASHPRHLSRAGR